MYIHINSEYLQLAEPLMAKYYDFHSTMLYDEIRHCVHISTVDYDKTFRENKDLTFIANVPYNTSIEEKFSTYFEILEDDDTDEEIITDDDIVETVN